jgi:hypothetical protein
MLDMKRTMLKGAWLLAMTGFVAEAAETITYETQPSDNEMLIIGKATGHEWKVKGVIIMGQFEVEPAWQKDLTLKSVTCLAEGKAPPVCQVRIPVKTLKSQVFAGKKTMDDRMIKEMKGQQFPNIDYQLTEMKLKGEVPAAGTPVVFETKGRLAIAGVTNQVAFPITMERLGPDKLKFKGTYNTKMTAFGIKPPEFTILDIGSKTADEITLTWTWLTGLRAAAK